MSYSLSDKAVQDIAHILEFLAKRNPSAALRFLEDFYASFEKLGENPHLGQEQSGISADARHWVVKPYRIFYRITDYGVEIIRVCDARQRITAQMFSD